MVDMEVKWRSGMNDRMDTSYSIVVRPFLGFSVFILNNDIG
jgi:hypothetical protein